ncbi:alcohol dehydrogenase catalytic domain-containing protein [Acrocarpospora sp. B8E8]|uniref:zinc-dependent alcohol dehydrogenase n=1 Tax=Acrocarpospora sp. B8E8 TaxID=3153572 RepID=UPI00325F6E0D
MSEGPKRALLTAPRRFEVAPGPESSLGPADVRMDVLAVGICGSDLATFRAGDAAPDQVLGHEIVARVSEAGALPVGARVMVRPMRSCGRCWYCAQGRTQLCDRSRELTLSFQRPGGYAEELILRDLEPGDVTLLAADVPILDAIWAEPLAVALHCVAALGDTRPGDELLVVGAGPLGLCVIAAAHARHLKVTVVEPRPARHATALAAGAQAVHPPGGPIGAFPWTIVAAGTPAALRLAVDATAPHGHIAVAALGPAPLPPLPHPIEIHGSFGYRTEEFRHAATLINTHAVRLGAAVTRTFPLTDINAAFAYSLEDQDAVKVAITPGAAGWPP